MVAEHYGRFPPQDKCRDRCAHSEQGLGSGLSDHLGIWNEHAVIGRLLRRKSCGDYPADAGVTNEAEWNMRLEYIARSILAANVGIGSCEPP